jgi:hypothetical protein
MTVRMAMRPLYIFFVIVKLIGLVFYKQFKSAGIDPDVFLLGNIFVFVLTMVSFYMLNKGLKAKTTFNFMSAVYGSFLMKFLVGAGAVVAYVLLAGAQKNLPAIFATMFLYLFYTFLEIKALLELLKKN